jgi:hypothetical protein
MDLNGVKEYYLKKKLSFKDEEITKLYKEEKF